MTSEAASSSALMVLHKDSNQWPTLVHTACVCVCGVCVVCMLCVVCVCVCVLCDVIKMAALGLVVV